MRRHFFRMQRTHPPRTVPPADLPALPLETERGLGHMRASGHFIGLRELQVLRELNLSCRYDAART